jgi:alcohol dehydrogenase class IV
MGFRREDLYGREGAPMDDFRYTSYAQEVIFGAGSLARLGETVERFGWQRLLLCSTGSMQRGGHIAKVERALGARLISTYANVQPHVPESQVAEVLELAQQQQIHALIGMGGGSAIGIAKAISFTLEEQRSGQPTRVPLPTDQPLVPVIAIPTTYAGSEMTPVYGVTHQKDGITRKITVTDPKIAPRLTLYDPLLTLDLPPQLTASTGINALAHCLEALYSITRNPLSTLTALGGIRAIMTALPRCSADGHNLEARAEMLQGSYLAATALAHVAMGLHHGICHVLGGTAGVPHGVANSIILPHALRFNLDATASELAQAAEAMGITTAGRSASAAAKEAIQRVTDLIGQLQVPRHLRETGVRAGDLPRLAELALQSRAVQSNPKPVKEAAPLLELLQAAW